MRKTVVLASLLFLPMLSGCAVSDMLFAVFGEEHYTGGGYTREEKKHDVDRHIEASQGHGSWNP